MNNPRKSLLNTTELIKNIDAVHLDNDDENRDKVGMEDISLKPKKQITSKKPIWKPTTSVLNSTRRISTGFLGNKDETN